MTEQVGLFDAHEFEVDTEPLSADRRRTVRQTEAIRRGQHPLAAAGIPLTLHPDADRDAARTDRHDLPLRCGSCAFRRLVSGGSAAAYPKCWFEAPTRTSHGAGTDVRAWWPSCPDYVPADPE